MSHTSTRREFLQQGIVTGAALASAGLVSAAPGANDRIRIGIIGCGGRASYHINWLKQAGQNSEIVAVCDIWRQKREAGGAAVKAAFGSAPQLYTDYRKLLESKDIDAVLIATPDHQHCTQLADAVRAGKDVYVEKPIAMELDELNAAYDAVKAAKAVVQHGTQGRSCAGATAARDFVQSGKLGKVLRIEESRSFYNPYWNGYRGPESEADTDWKAFLFNRPMRPFDSDQHGAWMGYRDFSSGTVGGWMSHFSDLNHYITGCSFPVTAVAQGGIYSPTSKKGRTCPDTVTAILEYAEGFTTSYSTHFGNGANDYIIWFGTKGVMRTGAPDGWPSGIEPKVSGEGSEHPEKIKDPVALENKLVEDHMVNWLKCIRTRQSPNANMDAGYKHGVAAILADRAFVEGRKMRFDPQARKIVPA
jgi:predicted dehydrogenase